MNLDSKIQTPDASGGSEQKRKLEGRYSGRVSKNFRKRRSLPT